MLLSIESEFIKVQLSPKGAELKSLVDFESGIDFIWHGDAKYWNRSAPILFPIVGGLQDDKYRIKNKFYPMSRHGFARDLDFEVVYKRKDSAQFRLDCNEDTLRVYPFRFRLLVTFKVYGPKLHVDYEVKNVDKKEMYFSLGSHPAFKCPFNGDNFEDYYLEFNKKESSGAFYLQNNLVNFGVPDDKRVFKNEKIFLTRDLFKHDALIFKDPISSKITLRSIDHHNFLSIEFGNAPYLGIWTPGDAPFVSIEPWHGVADLVGSNYDFLTKEGLITLEPSSNFKTSYVLTVG